MSRRFTLLLVLGWVLWASVAHADSAPMSTVGPHVEPMASTTVRLDWERIDISLREDRRVASEFSYSGIADYRVLFHFVPAKDETLKLGFPRFVYDGKQGIYGAPLEEFRVMADGREITPQIESGVVDHVQTSWATFPLTFRAGQPLDLEITYSLKAQPHGKGVTADLWIAYVLRTGALWAGPIGRVDAAFALDRPLDVGDLVASERFLGTTPGYKVENGALHWTWQNVEPDFDLSVQLKNFFWLDAPAEIAALAAGGGGQVDRETLLKVAHGMLNLFEGDARSGFWRPVREGSSEQVGARLLPAVLPLFAQALERSPQDWELWQRYLLLLSSSVWHNTVEGVHLFGGDRYPVLLAEYARYRAAGGAAVVPGVLLTPWLERQVSVPVSPLPEPVQAAVVEYLVREEMYASYVTEGAARDWVARAVGQPEPLLVGAPAAALRAEALRRVVPASAPGPGAQGSGEQPGAGDVSPSGPPVASPAEAPSSTVGLWWGLGALAFLTGVFAAAQLARRRRP